MDLFQLGFKIRPQVLDPQAFGLENEMGKEMIVEKEYSLGTHHLGDGVGIHNRKEVWGLFALLHITPVLQLHT